MVSKEKTLADRLETRQFCEESERFQKLIVNRVFIW
jgi:hypothetical protein